MDTDQQAAVRGGAKCGSDGVIRDALQKRLHDAAIAEARAANDAYAASIAEAADTETSAH